MFTWFLWKSDFSEWEIENLELLDTLELGENDPLPQEHYKIALEGVFKQFIDTPFENELTLLKDAIYKHFDEFDMWFDAQWSEIEHITLFQRATLHLVKETDTLSLRSLMNIWIQIHITKVWGMSCSLIEWIAGDLNAGYWRPLCSI